MEPTSVSKQNSRPIWRFLAGFLVAYFFLLPAASPLSAQTVKLTPAQQQMLNALPPAQRQQAMLALEQINRQGATDSQQSSISEGLSSVPPPAESVPVEQTEVATELEAEPGGRLIIDLLPKEGLTPQQLAEIQNDRALFAIQGRRYYELDYAGVLELPGLVSVPMLGLTADAIAQRLGAEPFLNVFDISVRILTTRLTGIQALEPFGYDVFESETLSFEPVATGPVPLDYVLGAGDTVRVQLFGNVNGVYEFEVSRDGILNLPELGPITAAGLTFSEFREDIRNRVAKTLIGTQVSITMGQLRTIRVFVLGDANRPGSYVVSSMATISSALYRSGGISDIGSLRNIQLKRQGALVARLDLYELLLRGDTSGDHRLQSGDVIFVPPIGAIAGVGGSVRRPAIYELRGPTTVGDTLQLAGGLSPDADPAAGRLERINDRKERVVIMLDASVADGLRMRVRGGDNVFIPQVLQELRESVVLVGHVPRPGPVQWRPNMRLTDLLPSAAAVKPGTDVNYVLIRRVDDQRRVSAVSASLAKAWAAPGFADDVLLQERDTVNVFNRAYGRQRTIKPIVNELQLQASAGAPNMQVEVVGQVRAPGIYPLESDMHISDLLRAGGFLSEDAYTLSAELTRFDIVDDSYRVIEIMKVDLDKILRGVQSADIALQPHDHLSINMLPDWNSARSVTLEGELRFPGEYQIRRNETLRELLERAGGLTDEAFPEGAIFLRESLREREQSQIDELARRMEAELTSMSLETLDTTGADTLSTGQVLLSQLRETVAVGRMVIDLQQIILGAPGSKIELRDSDQLLIPKRSQEITVLGETQQNASHMYRPGLTRDDYIDKSGGLTRRADKKLIYVVRASGAVESGNRSRWFGRGHNIEMRPGDTIVVPLETDRIRPLTFWTNATQILYQAAIAIAAVQTFK